MMSGGLLVWLIIGIAVYLLVSRRGGLMGCCCGHGDHGSGPRDHDTYRFRGSAGKDEDIIDLKKEDYHIQEG